MAGESFVQHRESLRSSTCRPPGPLDVAITVLALGLVLAGCTDDPDTRAASTPADSVDSDDSDPTSPAHLEGDSTLLHQGTYEFSFVTEHDRRISGALVDVPSGFIDGDDWYVVSEDGDAFLGMWTAQKVRRDACVLPRHDDLAPGPGVADLADALVAQKSTRATAPESVAFAGYQAVYLELTGPHHISKCEGEPGLTGVRGIYSDDQVDLLWIVDADGQRLVVDASFGPTATTAERENLSAMVDSLHLVASDK